MQLIKETDALVDLNVNPCKMCMPMGTCMAAYGVRGALAILHGSQGCATYIRRHMATHYNEPIDIASSSLTEQGTVMGGEANLHKGIGNLIRLYHPELVCVASTCLAETIGEDLQGMLERWREANPTSDTRLLAINSPGYGGSHYEGWFAFCRSLLEQFCPPANKPMAPARSRLSAQKAAEKDAASAAFNLTPAAGATASFERAFAPLDAPACPSTPAPPNTPAPLLNIICGPLSPADMRALKQLVAAFGINALLLPDISGNLDRPFEQTYERLPQEGTGLEQIRLMTQSALTLELATCLPDALSPGAWLRDAHGVPLKRLDLPIGLRGNDDLLAALASFAATDIPQVLQAARGRYLDALIDSHKYNAEGRAVICGEPDFCYSVTRLAVESGIAVVVVACGSKAPHIKSLQPEVAEVARRFLIDDFVICDNADFGTIERLALAHDANLIIGSSDARRIEERHGIPLVRAAFPIHDHVGGQRLRSIGYEGSLALLDRITNTLLDAKHRGFRTKIKAEFLEVLS
jgi:nitrogenase molybdenum-iron protein alpha/beta subunit